MSKWIWLLPAFLLIIFIIFLAWQMYADERCYKDEEGKTYCPFPFEEYSKLPIVNAAECSYYNCLYECPDQKCFKIRGIGSWSYVEREHVKEEKKIIKEFSCDEIFEYTKLCGEENKIKITIEKKSNNVIKKDIWIEIMESMGVDKDEAFIARAETGLLNRAKECEPLKGKAAIVFPENSKCMEGWWGIWRAKSCTLVPGNYEVWVTRVDEKDDYDIIICPEK